MEVAFIVKLNVPDDSSSTLAGYTEEIQDSLVADGLDVISITPWSRPSTEAPSASSPFSLFPDNAKTKQT